MAHLQIPSSVNRILKISVILMFISTVTILVIGFSILGVNNDVKGLNSFLNNAANVQPNFEKSLIMYTERTSGIINYLLELRPNSEEGYVQFISDIEDLGEKLEIDINLQSLGGTKDLGEQADMDFILYEIRFLGSIQDMENFLAAIETLDYFVAVDNIEYRDLKLVLEESVSNSKNIRLILKLFVK